MPRHSVWPVRSVSVTSPLEMRKSTVEPASADAPASGVVPSTVSAGTDGEFSRVSVPGVRPAACDVGLRLLERLVAHIGHGHRSLDRSRRRP